MFPFESQQLLALAAPVRARSVGFSSQARLGRTRRMRHDSGFLSKLVAEVAKTSVRPPETQLLASWATAPWLSFSLLRQNPVFICSAFTRSSRQAATRMLDGLKARLSTKLFLKGLALSSSL